MDPPAHTGLTLDIEELTASQGHPCSDAAGLAGGLVAQGQNGESVDLADHLSLCVDVDGAVFDHLPEPGLVYCLLDVTSHHNRCLVFAGPEVGLGNDLRHVHEPRGQLILVLDEAAGVVDDAGDGLTVERAELVLLAACGDKGRVLHQVLWRALHQGVELRGHLEVAFEVVVIGLQVSQ